MLSPPENRDTLNEHQQPDPLGPLGPLGPLQQNQQLTETHQKSTEDDQEGQEGQEVLGGEPADWDEGVVP